MKNTIRVRLGDCDWYSGSKVFEPKFARLRLGFSNLLYIISLMLVIKSHHKYYLYCRTSIYRSNVSELLKYKCNHYSPVIYMDASLSAQTKCQFNTFKCQNWEEFNAGKCAGTKGDSRMGFWSTSLPGRGNHYLKTTKDYPFC